MTGVSLGEPGTSADLPDLMKTMAVSGLVVMIMLVGSEMMMKMMFMVNEMMEEITLMIMMR